MPRNAAFHRCHGQPRTPAKAALHANAGIAPPPAPLTNMAAQATIAPATARHTCTKPTILRIKVSPFIVAAGTCRPTCPGRTRRIPGLWYHGMENPAVGETLLPRRRR
ncbi:hypothetical protein GCM10010885_05680 [Alicyclobacillus cellulosilyticus]|uniref:Uncharacterized protein n=1 Tax=Alicyclobacillus cellulosilyticus TaxID=1003997 RepID=A0A917K2W4_9BACL|nr:hypothetical protein GCM10010885_05680 [Alicyclobacillus cellulosilyticus]